jgi:hypothetical protein
MFIYGRQEPINICWLVLNTGVNNMIKMNIFNPLVQEFSFKF